MVIEAEWHLNEDNVGGGLRTGFGWENFLMACYNSLISTLRRFALDQPGSVSRCSRPSPFINITFCFYQRNFFFNVLVSWCVKNVINMWLWRNEKKMILQTRNLISQATRLLLSLHAPKLIIKRLIVFRVGFAVYESDSWANLSSAWNAISVAQ